MNTPSPLEVIFFAALEKGSPQERAAYLDETCAGDPDLRRRVERMLAAQSQARSFLEQPAADVGAAVDLPPVAEGPGTVIGPYELVEPIGEGGFGVVFSAQQAHPVRRKVALKVLRPGMDSRQVVARFEAERQALALMDHPNIARVFDGGTTEQGRPYFVMELVRGLPITDYCDQARLGIPDRLGLFVQVCRAVQHAHQKGVIHRDLKPSNVLVTVIDGSAVPKVIDFGVAKATGASLTDRTLHTGHFQLVGTPLYMSPEQAELSGVDVDTRSDVYSLGVLLYELLTGTTPFDPEVFRQAGLDEVRRMIREDDPPRPSRRVDTLAAGQSTTVADRRGVDVRRLGRLMRSELDWVVMKALEKDRDRRYESAGALAADVERYLASEPVGARPPSSGYRVRKFVGRNRGLALATALVVLTLCGGSVGTTWGLLRAVEERNEKDRARRDAERVVRDYFTQVGNSVLDNPALEPLRRELLDAALRYYGDFVVDHGDDPRLRAELAATYVRIAIVCYHLGPEYDWLTPFEKGVAILEVLLRERRDLGDLHGPSGGFRWFGSALGTYTSRPRETRDVMDRAKRVWEQLVDQNPHVPGFQLDLAAILLLHNAFGSHANDVEAAALPNQRAIELLQSLVAADSKVPQYRVGLAISLADASMDLACLNRQAEAEDCAAQSVAISKQLVDDFPGVPLYVETHVGFCIANLASVREHAGQFDEAADGYRERVRAYEALRRQYPMVPRFVKELFWSRQWLGEVLWAAGRRDEATREFEELAVLGDHLAPDDPWGLAAFSWFLALCPVDRLRDPKRAVELVNRAVSLAPETGDIWAALGAGHLAAGNDRAAIAALTRAVNCPCHFNGSAARLMLAQAHWRLGEQAEARKWYDRALERLNGTYLQLADTRRIRADTEKLLTIGR